MIQNARCAATTPPIRTTGNANGWRERCQVRYSTSAIAQAAPSSEIVMIFVKCVERVEPQGIIGDYADRAQHDQKARSRRGSRRQRGRVRNGWRGPSASGRRPHSTMPVTMVERPSVISTGASSAADGSVATRRSSSEAARIDDTATVELSGPAIANGSELPRPITAANTVEPMKVAAMPYDRYGDSGPRRSAAYRIGRT